VSIPDAGPAPTTAVALTRVFRAVGLLQRGEVADVRISQAKQTAVSELRFIDLEYSAGSGQGLPGRIVVKWPIEHSGDPDFIGAETIFYRELAPQLSSPPIVRCLATAPPEGIPQWVILEDVSPTHRHVTWPERPSDEELIQCVVVLARLHARWWAPSGSEAIPGTPHTEESLRSLVYGVKAHLPAFLKDLGNDLAEADQSTLKTVFNSSLAPWLRLADGRDLTVIHGDAHAWNFLFDRRGTDTPYLIDWQTWHRDVGARDLAYLIALHWDAPTRQQLERPLLWRYHQELIRSGISTYSFDDLVLDYRRCVVRNLTFPVIYWSRGFPRESWRYRLDCALAAYRDLDAAELLSREA
jgi:hypothetical protein